MADRGLVYLDVFLMRLKTAGNSCHGWSYIFRAFENLSKNVSFENQSLKN